MLTLKTPTLLDPGFGNRFLKQISCSTFAEGLLGDNSTSLNPKAHTSPKSNPLKKPKPCTEVAGRYTDPHVMNPGFRV